jgi:hypothetical protein
LRSSCKVISGYADPLIKEDPVILPSHRAAVFRKKNDTGHKCRTQ